MSVGIQPIFVRDAVSSIQKSTKGGSWCSGTNPIMLKTCKKCNVVFGTEDASTHLCEKCRTTNTLTENGLRDKYAARAVSKETLIKEFVRATPLASPQEVILYMEQVEKPVTMQFISNMITEGQIMLNDNVPSGNCFECGKPVLSGSLCAECSIMRRKRIEKYATQTETNNESARTHQGMHISNTQRKRL